MKKIVVLILTLVNAHCFAQNFPFYIPYDDSTTQTFLPHFPRKAINDVDFIGTDKDKFTKAGKPMLFWGANVVADGAFPLKTLAPSVASHMRKMGFNLMRFHHMDNGWGALSMFLNGKNTRVINETYRDRFEYFVAQMKNEGVYIDLNLLVSRLFKTADGIPGADSITDFEAFKTPALFNHTLITLQKDYARNILTHKNPYLGKSLVNDPVMAVVEIANENSIYRDWMNNALKPLSQGGKLLYKYSIELDSLWNDYLKTTYKTTSALQSAWNVGISSNIPNSTKNGDFEKANTTSWILEKNGTTMGTFSIDSINNIHGKYCGKFIISNYDGTGWHMQLKQKGISIQKDSIYQVTFWAKSSVNTKVIACTSLEINPWTTYSYNTITVTTNWQEFTYTFKASETKNNDVRISFNTESNTTIWFDDISFSQPIVAGLDSTETIENASIKRTDYTNRFMVSEARLKDQTSFYLELERNYFTSMKSFLKDTLGVKVPITGTAWFVGPEDDYIAEVSDFVDNHAYFDHPQFPSKPWSATDWFISNKSMLKNKDHGTLPILFGGYQIKNKPFTISEYNHPYPNQYQSEMLPSITAYSAFQGVDAIMFFTYNGSTDWTTDIKNEYFDLCKNNTILSGMPLFSYVFRNNKIKEADTAVELSFTKDDIRLWAKTNSQSIWASRAAVSNDLPMTQKIVTASFADSVSIFKKQVPVNPKNPYKTTTSEIEYDTTGIVSVNTTQFISVAGYLQNYPAKKVGALIIDSAKIFGELAWLALDSVALTESKKSILQLSSFQENTGMQWFNNNTTKDQWGKSPTLQYPQKITLTLNINAKALRIYLLDSLGNESPNRQHLFAPVSSGLFTITFDQNVDKTLWYGLQAFDSDSVLTLRSVIAENVRLLGNPASQELIIDNGNLNVKKYSITSIQGIVLLSEQGDFSAIHSINISQFAKGMYFLNVETGNEKRVISFIKN